MVKSLLYYITYVLCNHSSLSKRSWKNFKSKNSLLLVIKKEIRKKRIVNSINNAKASFLITTIIAGILIACCFIKKEHTSKYFFWLQYIEFRTYEDASGLIGEMLGAAATIVGLSFVVIGLLVETVKNQSKVDYRSIFKISGMYYGFSISIVGLLCLIIFSILKFAVNDYIIGNLAIASIIALFVITLSIGIIFFSFLRFLSPQTYAIIARQQFLHSLKKQLLKEYLLKEMSKVYTIYLRALKFSPLRIYLPPNEKWLLVKIKKENELLDIMLPLFLYPLKKLRKRVSESFFNNYPHSNYFIEEHKILTLPDNQQLSRFEMFLFQNSMVFRKLPQENNFHTFRKASEDKLMEASRKGDLTSFNQAAEELNTIYNLHYQINKK
jgi:hypothetical protein